MKFRSFLTGLAVLVVALLLVGAGGLFWLVSSSPLKLLQTGGTGSPAATMFVPKQAPAMVSLLVNPDQLESFRLAIAPLNQRQQARTELSQIKQGLLTNLGLDYAKDVQPWLGDEITVAVTTPDIDRDADNGRQPGYLLAIATRDPDRAKEFLQLFWQKRAIAGTDLVFEQYAGVKLIHAQIDPASPLDVEPASLTTAVVGDRFVLFANYPKVLRDAITNVQAPDLNLSSSSGYQQALNALPDRQIGMVFANLPQLAVWLGEQFQPVDRDMAIAKPQRMYDGLVMALSLNSDGVLADTALLAPPGQTLTPKAPQLSEAVEAAKFIPTNSPVVVAGMDLRQLWQEVQTGLVGYETLAALIQQPLDTAQRQWGVESADLLDWVQSDYALGIVPQGTAQPDWVFATQNSDTVQTAMAHLEAIARQKGVSTGNLMVGDRQVTAWTELSLSDRLTKRNKPSVETIQAKVRGIHTTVGDYELVATSVNAMEQALQSANQPLMESDEFQRAIAPLNPNNDGYLYVDWPAVKSSVSQKLPLTRLVETVAQPFLSHVKSFTITSYGSETTLRRGAVFVRLQP